MDDSALAGLESPASRQNERAFFKVSYPLVPGGGRGSGRFSAVAQPMELNSRLPSTARKLEDTMNPASEAE
jgi:hypothetical protein